MAGKNRCPVSFLLSPRLSPKVPREAVNGGAPTPPSWLLNKILCDLQKKGNMMRNYQSILHRSNLHVFI